jgi:hypothetical protein
MGLIEGSAATYATTVRSVKAVLSAITIQTAEPAYWLRLSGTVIV